MIRTNDSDRYFSEVMMEQAMLDDINRELRELAAEAIDAAEFEAYLEYLRAMLHAFYDATFPTTEWDLI